MAKPSKPHTPPLAESQAIDPEVVAEALAIARDLGYGDEPEREFTISRGIVLRAVSAPPHLIADLELRYPEPDVPLVDITDPHTGEIVRQEPNPDDREYRDAHMAWRETAERLRQRALLATAIEIVRVPDGVPGPDDDAWIEPLRYAGLDVPIPDAGTRGRTLAWLLYFALRDVADLNRATVRAMRMVGVPEGDVSRMVRLFRDHPQWRANQRRAAAAPRPN